MVEEMPRPASGPAELAGEAHPEWLATILEGRRKLIALWNTVPTRQLEKGHVLWMGGEPAPGIYQLVRGWALRSRVLSDGRSIALNSYLTGDVIGMGALMREHSPDEVSLLTPCTVRFMENRAVREFWSDPAMAVYLGWLLARKQWRSDVKAAALSVGTARERLASTLLYYYLRLKRSGDVNGDTFVIPLTQQQIAELLGTTVVHANRTLRWFYAEGIMNVTQKQVTILDLRRLRELATPDDSIGILGLTL